VFYSTEANTKSVFGFV